jgi:methyl-accepting chemotaxis protein
VTRVSQQSLHPRYFALCVGAALTAMLPLAGYLVAVLQLSGAQWRFLGLVACGLFLACTSIQTALDRPLLARIADVAGRAGDGSAGPTELRHAFAGIMSLPRRALVATLTWWAVAGCVLALCLALRFPGAPRSSPFVLLASLAASGVLAGILIALGTERLLGEPRRRVAERLEDPDEREALVREIPLRRKLLVSITGVMLLPIVLAVWLAQVYASRPFETFTVQRLEEQLERVLARTRREGLALPEAARIELAAPATWALLDGATGAPVQGAPDALYPLEVDAIRNATEARGNSLSLGSRNVFAWVGLPDGRVAVASTPWSVVRQDLPGPGWELAALVALGLAVPLAVAALVAGNVERAAGALQAEAARVASGDFSRGPVFESDDELGGLFRGFSRMQRALRATVGHIAAAADRVEATAGGLSAVGVQLGRVSDEQRSAIEQATSSMDRIRSEVHGVAQSARALAVSVEDSSGSVTELGAIGAQLEQTASRLSTQAHDVSASIEEVIRSLREVTQNTEALATATNETSVSMEQIASSMQQVDANAAETARLSSRVVMAAEEGRVRVQQTAQGMQQIREATQTAEAVIHSLGARAREIGAVVSVIDDVADETNLLALNAAIIAAQAGEHGRSFSVVADEIRDLAERVLASTKEIASLIKAVQSESANAVQAIERGARSVEGGVELSQQAGISLDEITQAARESGARIAEIVVAVREQTKSATHVARLMERVRVGVDHIQAAGREQDRGNEVVLRSSTVMRDVSRQVRGTTEQQGRGTARIRDSIEAVREVVGEVERSLHEQSTACQSALEFLTRVSSRTGASDEAARSMQSAMRDLQEQARSLREEAARFRV